MRKQYDFSKGKRGAVIPLPTPQTRISLARGDDVLDWFRERVTAAGGRSYEALINEALRTSVAEQTSLELVLRRVVREELRRAQGAR